MSCNFCAFDNLVYIPDFNQKYGTAINLKEKQISIDNHNNYCLICLTPSKEIIKTKINFCPKCGKKLSKNNYHILHLIKNSILFDNFLRQENQESSGIENPLLPFVGSLFNDLPSTEKSISNILLDDSFSAKEMPELSDKFFKNRFPFLGMIFLLDEQVFIEFVLEQLRNTKINFVEEINVKNRRKLIFDVLELMESSKDNIQNILKQFI